MSNKRDNGNTTKGPTRQMRRRSVLVMVVLLVFCFSAILGRLAYIQIAQADTWRSRAVNQQLNDYVTSAMRGTIYDTNGEILAKSAPVWTVVMSPLELVDKDDEAATEARRVKLAKDLSEILGVDRDALYEKTQRTKSQYEVVKAKIEYPEMVKVSEWVESDSISFANSVRLVEDYKRYYPQGKLLSHILGFTGTENSGLYGLEAKFEDVLAGLPGRIVTIRNGVGNKMASELRLEKTIDAEEGKSLVLTIDRNVQYYLEKHLEDSLAESKARNQVTGIVMNVNTGEILGMATKGDFDPNEPMEITDPAVLKHINSLTGDAKTEAIIAAREYQWANKAISYPYDPGSVFKVFTASMALEEDLFNETSTFNCDGFKEIGGHKIHCHRTWGHGLQTFVEAVSNSCNPAFMDIGAALTAPLFARYHRAFGFVDKTGVDLPGESSISEGLYFKEDMSETDLAVAAFGQNFKVTPIQMITALSAVANGGKLMEPYLVKQVLDVDGNVISTTQPTVKRQVISEETSDRMNKILGSIVNGGGSKNAYLAGYRMAGKTGTSEKKDPVAEGEYGKVVATFGGYAPADDPQYAILVIVDEPNLPENERYGSMLATPTSQKIMADILPYLGVEPIYTEEERANMERSTPDVTGMSVTEARSSLDYYDLEVSIVGEGSTVLKQVPESYTNIPRDGMVVIYTEEEGLSRTATVPDFSGMSISEANTTAASNRLNIQIVGLDSQSGGMRAASQSVAKDSKVPLGTIIQVTFVYEDNTA